MRCAKCGAASRVKETRENRGLFYTKRRRACDNGHVFTTFEIHSGAFAKIGTAKYRAKVACWNSWVTQYARDLRAWTENRLRGRTLLSIAKDLGMTESAVAYMCKRIDRDRKDPNAS